MQHWVPALPSGHGTHCASTIAAAGNNQQGMAGMSWGAKFVVSTRHPLWLWAFFVGIQDTHAVSSNVNKAVQL